MTLASRVGQRLAHVFDAAGRALCGLPATFPSPKGAPKCPVCFAEF